MAQDFDPDAYLARATDDFNPDAYLEEPQKSKSWGDTAADYGASAIPLITGAGGSATGSILGPVGAVGGGSIGYAGGRQLEKYVREHFLDQKQDPTTPGEIGTDLALGGLFEVGGQVLAKPISKVGKYITDKLGNFAVKAAENATGATRVQSERFAPNAGRELLDRGIVKFGSSPAGIAKRAEIAMTSAEGTLDDVLKTLDKNKTIMPEEVISQLDNRITQLRADPSTAPQASQLETIKENIVRSMEDSPQLPSTIEGWKRGFGKNSNWNDPEKALARKEAYQVLRNTVEGAAQETPATATAFKEAKDTWGLLAPIREASEKRALQLQQHPVLGLKDLATAGAGAIYGDPTLGIATAVGRRLIAPRISSSAAVTANLASKSAEKVTGFAAKSIPTILRTNPQILGRFAGPLQDALPRGDSAVAMVDFLLSQTEPEYAEIKKQFHE